MNNTVTTAPNVDSANRLRTYLDSQIAKRPIEREIIERIAKALRDVGNPVVRIWDGEENVAVSTDQSILDQAFNLDELSLHTADGSGVFLVMGEGWDMITDYHLSLDSALEPVMQWSIEGSESE